MSAMKDSGIPWIGMIPEGWEVIKCKNVLIKHSRPIKNDYEIVTCFRDGTVTLRKNRRTDGFTESLKEIGYQGVLANDLVIHQMDAFAGSIGVSDSEGKSSPVYMVCTTTSNHSVRFLSILLRTMAFTGYILSLAQGIRQRSTDLRFEKLKHCLLALPPLETQQRIADYLDEKCAKIDEIVAKEGEVIEKLKAYKLSLITETVTKGLDPNAEMKDSGIEWIGMIPEGWKVVKQGFLTSKIGSGKTPLGGAETYSNEGILFLRSQNIYNEGLLLTQATYITEATDSTMTSSRVYKGDVLLNITGGSIGRSCIYTLENHANVNQHVCIIRPKKKSLISKILNYFWISNAGQTSIDIFQSGANREGMNFNQITNTKIPLPPLGEQQAIADYLDEKCAKIDERIAKKHALIEKLGAYKKSLIYEVVTGKKEV